MGINVEAYLSHDLPQSDDAAAILARMQTTLSAAIALRDHWRSVYSGPFDGDRWQPGPMHPRLALRRYEGPGGISLTVTPTAAMISTLERWNTFLTSEPVRRLHFTVYRATAAALQSPTIAVCAESQSNVLDLFLAGRTQDECIAQLRSVLGSPQTSVTDISPDIAERADRNVWFLWDPTTDDETLTT